MKIKRQGFYFEFITESGKSILIDGHCWTLKQATELAQRQDKTATYKELKLFF